MASVPFHAAERLHEYVAAPAVGAAVDAEAIDIAMTNSIFHHRNEYRDPHRSTHIILGGPVASDASGGESERLSVPDWRRPPARYLGAAGNCGSVAAVGNLVPFFSVTNPSEIKLSSSPRPRPSFNHMSGTRMLSASSGTSENGSDSGGGSPAHMEQNATDALLAPLLLQKNQESNSLPHPPNPIKREMSTGSPSEIKSEKVGRVSKKSSGSTPKGATRKAVAKVDKRKRSQLDDRVPGSESNAPRPTESYAQLAGLAIKALKMAQVMCTVSTLRIPPPPPPSPNRTTNLQRAGGGGGGGGGKSDYFLCSVVEYLLCARF